MSTQHTPGPWTLEVTDWGDSACTEIHGNSITDVGAVIYNTAHCEWSFEREANARLIAAAPTMADYIRERAQQGDAAAQQIMEQINGNA